MSRSDAEMAGWLRRLELLSHGSTQAWNATGGHSGEPDDRIVGQVLSGEEPPHLAFRRLYEAQTTEAGRQRVVELAREEWEGWARRSAAVRLAQAQAQKSLAEIVLEDGEGHEPEVVARKFCVDAAWVRRKRADNGRDTESGRRGVVRTGDPAVRARELQRKGVSTRQIALALGVHQTQVMRWIRADARAAQ